MKLQILTGVMLASGVVQAATYYACGCGAGAAATCVPGAASAPYNTPAKALTTAAQYKAQCQALVAGDHLSHCQGGAIDGVATGNMSCAGTAANPVVLDSYDDSARWTGGAGIKPVLSSTATGAILSLNKPSAFHTEGLVIRDLELRGAIGSTNWGILIGADTDYVTIDNVTVSGTKSAAIQCNGGTLSQGTGDGQTRYFTVRNSTISGNAQQGILTSCADSLIEGNTFANNGTGVGDHDIYFGGNTTAMPSPKTIASITGNGTTATLTTSAGHGLAGGAHFTITVAGSTSSGTGTFNVVSAVGTVASPTTLTYAASGTPSAGTKGSYTTLRSVPVPGAVARRNLMTEAGISGACGMAHLVMHGDWSNVLIEDNTITDSVTPSNGSCMGIEVDSGYSTAPPEDYEKFNGVTIRGNTIIGPATGICVDLARRALIENNYAMVAVTGANQANGIRSRCKNFVPGTTGTSTLAATSQEPDNVTIRHNTVYLPSPNAGSWGIGLNANAGDPLAGSHHNLYGNVVVLGITATTATMCYATQNITLAMFDVKDHNACYYLGSAVPKWENTSALATVQAAADANRSDLHSLFGASANPTTGQPFLLSPSTGPAIGGSSALKNAGHATLGPANAWGRAYRNQGVRDIGAFEYLAPLNVVPDAPVRAKAP